MLSIHASMHAPHEHIQQYPFCCHGSRCVCVCVEMASLLLSLPSTSPIRLQHFIECWIWAQLPCHLRKWFFGREANVRMIQANGTGDFSFIRRVTRQWDWTHTLVSLTRHFNAMPPKKETAQQFTRHQIRVRCNRSRLLPKQSHATDDEHCV